VGLLAVALGIGFAGAAGFALPQAHADEGSGVNSSDASSGQTADRKDASTPASGATHQASSADTESADTDEPGTNPKDTSEPGADDSSPSAGEHTPAAGADADADADKLDAPDSGSIRQSPRSSSQSRPHRSAPPAAEHERQDAGSSDSASESAPAGRATDDHAARDEVDGEAAPRPVELTNTIPVIERIDHPSVPRISDGADSDSDDFAVVTKAIRGVLSADATSGPGSTADGALMLALLAWTRRGTKLEAEAAPQVVATTETLEDPPTSEDDTIAPAAFVSARASVTVTATTNEAPTAADDTKTIVEDTPRTFDPSELTYNDTDPEHNSPLAVDSVDNAVGGAAVLNGDGTVTFTPESNFNGAASFTYKVKDALGAVSANSATVTVNVLGVNDAPTAVADTVSPSVGKSYTFTAAQLLGNDTDPDTAYGDSVSIRSVGGATGGSVYLNGDGTVTFTPVAGSDGSGSFTYVVKDSKGAVSPAATVTIVPVNQAPTAVNDTKTIVEDTPRTFAPSELTANDTDPEHSALSFNSVGNGVGGTAVLNGDGTVTFTPEANFNGAASFTYTVKDAFGAVSANSATVTVNVLGVNDAPTAVADTVSPSVGSSYTFTAAQLLGNDTDPDTAYGDSISIRSVGGATGGTVHLNSDGTVTFIPTTAFTGGSFTYVVKDSKGAVSPAATVTIVPVNQAPTAVNDTKTIVEDNSRTFTADDLTYNDIDPEHSPLSFNSVDNAVGGTVVLNGDGTVTFTPEENFNGEASFTYTVKDSLGAVSANSAVVTVNVLAEDDVPVAGDDAYTTNEDTSLIVSLPSNGLLANDTDIEGDDLTAVLVDGPSHGSLLLNDDGTFTYTPNANFAGTDSFTYAAADPGDEWGYATVTVNVTPVNDAPVAANDSYTTNEDTPLTVTLPGVLGNDSDVEGSALTASVVSGPTAAQGTLAFNSNGTFTFTPTANFNGVATFTYKVSDGVLTSNTATVTINVTPVNDAPVAANDTFTTSEDTPLTASVPGVLGNDSDAEGSALTASLVSGPTAAQGTLAFNSNGTFTFTPAANFNGAATFTYKVSDGVLTSNTATVTINVTPVNDAPVATGQSYTAWYNYGIPGRYKIDAGDLRDHASDVETPDSGLTWTLVSGPTKTSGLGGNGTLVLNSNGTFTYNTDDANIKTVQFTYKVTDPSGASSATVTVVISTSL